jgi:hypothetical protein
MSRIALSDFQFRQLVSGHVEPKFAEGSGFDVESRSRAENSLLIQVETETSRLSWVSPNREAVSRSLLRRWIKPNPSSRHPDRLKEKK